MQRETLKFNDIEKDLLEEVYSGNPQQECLIGFSERMKNLAPFVCLVRRLGNLQKYPDYDIFSLGLGVMLFVLENMLIGHEEGTIDEISDFLQTIIYKTYHHNIPQEDARELAFYIRDAITGNGETYQFEYMNLQKATGDSVPVKLMDVSYYEIKKTSKYKLTDQGMELLFKTREIYSEFRLNVTQLYLRQQIEKGVFVGAIQTVNELSLQVRQLRERIESIMEEIRQNVLGVKFEDLKSLLERIQEQFNIERREFTNIRHILGEQKKSLECIDIERLTAKDIKALRYIRIISEKIGIVAGEHNRLFSEKLDILGEYLKMLEFRMRAGITEYMDYERSIFDKLGNENLGVETAAHILSPLFQGGAKNKVFNIMKTFEPQKIRQEEQEERESIDFDVLLEKREQEQKEAADRRNRKIEGYLEGVLKMIPKEGVVSLSTVIQGFEGETYRQASVDFDFFSLIVMLHQKKELDLNDIAGIGQSMVYDAAYNIDLEFLLNRLMENNTEVRELGRISFVSTTKVYTFENGNIISDFLIGRID